MTERLPVEPFEALIREQVARHGSLAEVVRIVEGRPEGVSSAELTRSGMYRRLLDWTGRGASREYRTIDPATADLIVTRLVGAEGWFTRAELREVYR